MSPHAALALLTQSSKNSHFAFFFLADTKSPPVSPPVHPSGGKLPKVFVMDRTVRVNCSLDLQDVVFPVATEILDPMSLLIQKKERENETM